jgi:hypothetical protein
MTRFTLVALIAIFSVSIFPSCGNEKKQEAPAAKGEHNQYQCPMKCTEEMFDKPGTCPSCGMELKKVNEL